MTSSHFTLANAIRATILFGLFTVLFVLVQSCQGPQTELDRFSTGSLKGLTSIESPPPLPSATYRTADGAELKLAELKGKVVLVNVWATWCPPCVAEMPSLNRLQSARGGNDFQVITISLDKTREEAAQFFDRYGLDKLDPWHDGTYGLSGNLNLRGYPTTVIYARDGYEIARLQGEAEWDSEEALALVDYLVGR